MNDIIPVEQDEVKAERNMNYYILKDEYGGMTRNYYRTWKEAESHRRKGERIYLNPDNGYYIVRPKKRSWWDIF